MIWSAALALIVQRRFAAAAGWMATASVLSTFGVIHTYLLSPSGVEGRIGWWVAPQFTLPYAAGAVFLAACEWYRRRSESAGRVTI
jgi:adenine/guanine/hypoxanthine permease